MNERLKQCEEELKLNQENFSDFKAQSEASNSEYDVKLSQLDLELKKKCIENRVLKSSLNDRSKELVEHQNAIQELNFNNTKTFDEMKSAFELEVELE